MFTNGNLKLKTRCQLNQTEVRIRDKIPARKTLPHIAENSLDPCKNGLTRYDIYAKINHVIKVSS